jgi:L-talarate/galactarate dehydratase
MSLEPKQIKTPIAVGEYFYGRWPFVHALARGVPDIVMIDPFRSGGIGGWLQIADLARQHDRDVVSHLSPEIQLHLVAAVPNGRTVEYMPWLNRLYESMPWPVNGYLEMPDQPGLSISFDEDAVSRFCVEKQIL